MFKYPLTAVLIILLTLTAFCSDDKPWAFFDIGDTITVYTPTTEKYTPQAHDYLKTLKDLGFHLGLLVNWPEDEGDSDSEKFILTKEYIEKHWIDTIPFDMYIFETAYFPPKNKYYKPHPYLFKKALKKTGPCNAIYQGEDEKEIRAARKAGLMAHRVNLLTKDPDKFRNFLSPQDIFNKLEECRNALNDEKIKKERRMDIKESSKKKKIAEDKE